MAKFNGEITLAEEDKFFHMQDEIGNKIAFALLGWAQNEDEKTYLIMQTMDGSMDEAEALLFLQTEDGVELVEDLELVESVFDAYNSYIDSVEE